MFQQEGVRRDLENMELSKTIANDLDFPISDKEILRTSKILKDKKASSSDLVKNEMIKASCGSLLSVYEKLFKVVRNSFPFSIPAELYERLTRL